MGDLELVIKQINAEYFVHNPRLARYRDAATDLVDDLLECKFAIIPRNQNLQAHCLATFASTCNLPFQPTHRYTAEVKYRTIVPDNVKCWQIFSEDEHIYHFLNSEDEFQNCMIDTDGNLDSECNIDLYVNCKINNIDAHKLTKPTVFTQFDIDNLEKVDIEEVIEDEIEMLDLKDNFLPKGLTHLEDLFDSNDVPKKPKMESVKCNIE